MITVRGTRAVKAAPGSESARRALSLLTAFSPERHTLTARQLADDTAIPLPSVYRYLAFLREAGLLAGDGGCYHLSARLIALARAAEAAETLIDIADPVMRRLAAETTETVILVRLVARSAVCVHRVETTTHRLRTSYEPGQALPLEHGASARLLLASMSPAARREYLAPLAGADPAAAARLEEKIRAAGRRGWTTSEEEIDQGVWAAAAAIRDSSGIIAALSVPSPLVRAPKAMQEKLLGQVRAAAGEINAALASAHR